MMKFFTLCMISFFMSTSAFSQATFQRIVYLPDSIYYSYVGTTERSDLNFVNMIDFTDLTNTNRQIHLTETDPAGNVIWYKKYSGAALDNYLAFDMIPDGRFSVAGQYNAANGCQLIFDSAGSLLSANEFDFPSSATINYMTHSPDSHYVICGSQNAPGSGMVIETDLSGNFLHANEYLVNNHRVYFNRIVPMRDNSRVILGQSSGAGVSKPQMIILKTDAVGNVLWGLQFGDTAFTMGAIASFEMADSSILVVGSCIRSNPTFIYFPFISKISASGHTLWTRKLIAPDFFSATDAVYVSNDKFALSAYHIPSGSITSSLLMMFDTSGTIQSTVRYEDPSYSLTSVDLLKCRDNGFLMTGMIPSGTGFIERYFLKTDSSFHGNCGESTAVVLDSLIIFYDSTGAIVLGSAPSINSLPLSNFNLEILTPIELDACDPSQVNELENSITDLRAYVKQNKVCINFSLGSSRKINISICDISGRIIFNQSTWGNSGVNVQDLDIQKIQSGMYLIFLDDQANKTCCKIMIEQSF